MKNANVSSTIALAFAIALLAISFPSAYASVAEIYYSMGQDYMEKGNFDMAALALEKVVEIIPEWAEAHNALGEAYVGVLRFEDAVAEFDKAIQIKSDYTQAKINRRRAMMSIERYKPVEGSKFNRWHKFAILGGITVTVAAAVALFVYLSS